MQIARSTDTSSLKTTKKMWMKYFCRWKKEKNTEKMDGTHLIVVFLKVGGAQVRLKSCIKWAAWDVWCGIYSERSEKMGGDSSVSIGAGRGLCHLHPSYITNQNHTVRGASKVHQRRQTGRGRPALARGSPGVWTSASPAGPRGDTMSTSWI